MRSWASAAAALVTVQLEDMIGVLEPVNIPGTSSEYSNWTRRMPQGAREIFARADVESCARGCSPRAPGTSSASRSP